MERWGNPLNPDLPTDIDALYDLRDRLYRQYACDQRGYDFVDAAQALAFFAEGYDRDKIPETIRAINEQIIALTEMNKEIEANEQAEKQTDDTTTSGCKHCLADPCSCERYTRH
jgi:aldehyde:ferredoxin oxidoreductase